MKVYQVAVGPMQNFSYIVEDESTHEAIIIDPSWDLDKIIQIVEEQNLNPKYLVNTHWHDDHTRGNEELAKELSLKIVQHSASDLKNDMTVSDGDSIKFGCSELVVYHTPGHSKDSICLVGDGKIFSGDTLFVGNCGRIDLPGGSSRELYHSLFDVISNLNDSLIMYPGHDYGSAPTSTIGNEKMTNTVMQKISEEDFVMRMGG
jgi:glyoxylase-like metal-dependent hydrolase (beta-lactamase superfamily II)|tara:strand:+ start:138 stop:749 length:612 start_codon:yes stop_codon:yes gene_type:complete